MICGQTVLRPILVKTDIEASDHLSTLLLKFMPLKNVTLIKKSVLVRTCKKQMMTATTGFYIMIFIYL